MKVLQIFIKNTINIILNLIPMILIIIFWALNKTDNIVLILIYITACIIIFSLSTGYIVLNIKILTDLVKKETESLTSEVEAISSAWEWRSPFVKRKYVTDLFTSNYICVYDILLNKNEKYEKVTLFIPRKELEKTNFFNLYELNYQAAKQELIIQKNINYTICLECTYYKHSKIIKEFRFFIKQVAK